MMIGCGSNFQAIRVDRIDLVNCNQPNAFDGTAGGVVVFQKYDREAMKGLDLATVYCE